MFIGIVKKWLEALKSDIFTHETFGYFLETFKFLLTKNLSADTMRSLALYITYAVHKPKQQASTPARGKSIKLRTDLPYRRQTLSSPSPQLAKPRGDTDRQLNQIEVALRILEIYADILCVRDDVSNIKKFARTVTNKVGSILSFVEIRLKLCSGYFISLLMESMLWFYLRQKFLLVF